MIVRCLMVDFTKAFFIVTDTVDHVILLSKLAQLNLPAFIINWICSFLTGRSQQCKVNGALSDDWSQYCSGLWYWPNFVYCNEIWSVCLVWRYHVACAWAHWHWIGGRVQPHQSLGCCKLLTFKSDQDKRNGFRAAKDYIFSSTACCRWHRTSKLL